MNIELKDIVFLCTAVLTVAPCFVVALSRNVLYSAFALFFTFLGASGLYFFLDADFLAIVQVLVYGGAVTILILFSMMLTRVRDLPVAPDGPQKPIAFVASLAFLGTSVAAIASTEFRGESTEEISVIPFEDIGPALFTTWAIPFEIASLVLMVALIGAIILARGEEGE